MKFKCLLLIWLLVFAVAQSFAGDPTPSDLKGIPKKNRYIWAVVGGTAVGAGIGLLAPGGNKSVAKGALIGGSGASFLYLNTHRRAISPAWRPWAHIITNTALGTGIGWTACNCNSGAGIGALIGGGGTVIIQGFRPQSRGLSRAAGVSPPSATAPTTTTPPPH
ncbi:MAG TPA: hypothetical protein VFL42_03125 [Terriglobales bacterium]|nr:hypothetical protein [Terriglobales bacterium]